MAVFPLQVQNSLLSVTTGACPLWANNCQFYDMLRGSCIIADAQMERSEFSSLGRKVQKSQETILWIFHGQHWFWYVHSYVKQDGDIILAFSGWRESQRKEIGSDSHTLPSQNKEGSPNENDCLFQCKHLRSLKRFSTGM